VGLPVVLVAGGLGGRLGLRAYTGRCSASFPGPSLSKDIVLPQWRGAADTGGAEAEAAAGTAPFGKLVSVASYPHESGSGHHESGSGGLPGDGVEPLTFAGGTLLLGAGHAAFPAPSHGALVAVDPRDGTLRWSRGYGGVNTVGTIDDSTVLSLRTDGDDDEEAPRAAAIDARGELRWCTKLARTGEFGTEVLDSVVLDDGTAAVLHKPPVDEDGHPRVEYSTMVSLLDLATGKVRRSITLPPVRTDAQVVPLRGLHAFGSRILVGPFATVGTELFDNLLSRTSPYPTTALDLATGQVSWQYTMPASAVYTNWATQVVATTADRAVVFGAYLDKSGGDDAAVPRFRLAGIDQAGQEKWHVDGLPWHLLTGKGKLSARRFGDLLVTDGSDSGRGDQLRAYRIADGTVAWTAPLSVQPGGLADAAVAGRFLLVPAHDRVVVVDLAAGKQVGAVALTGASRVVAGEDYLVVSADGNLLTWQRGG
jgi:outer membrane protein assembly factor BamB